MKHEEELISSQREIFEKIKRGEDPLPLCLEINPTDLCNQKCKYCFHRGKGYGKKRQVNRFMQLEDYIKLFEEMAYLNIRILSISGGGEPFMHKDIFYIINKALKKKLKLRIVTNGNFLTPRLIKKILEIEEIRFSIDSSDAKAYSKARGVPGYLFERTLDNIKNILKFKGKENSNLIVGIACMVKPQNIDQLSQFTELMLGEIKVDKVLFKYDIYEKVKNNEDFYRKAKQKLENIEKKYRDKVEIRPKLPDFKTGLPCVVPYFKSSLNPYGELYSCCLGAQPGENNGYKLGNFMGNLISGVKNPLLTTWEGSKKIRIQMLKKTLCSFCNFTDRNINNQYIANN